MKRFILLFSVLFFGMSFTTDPNPPVLKELIKEDMPYLLDFYKHRHRTPEISLQEKQTAKELAAELRKVGFEVTENFGGYGIVGILKNGDGPLILYRTDMDALPMYEKTKLPYASKKEIDYNGTKIGSMHACGHDVHMTTWVGTARAMAKMKDKWHGTLMLIGQPAEEIGAGAKLMLDAGLYQKFGVPDYGIGLHSSPTIKAGKIGTAKGYTMASVESVDIKVFGVGAHGASPHMSIDPVVLASMMVMEFQTIVSRSLKPVNPAVVTVGAIQGGVKHNIIPDEVTLKLTVRTYTEEVRQLVNKRLREIARGTAIAAGLPEDKMPVVIIPENGTPANYNDPDLIDKLNASASKVIGKENIEETEALMLGEDFSRYGQTADKVPTVLFWLGTVTDEKIKAGDLPGLHSPYYFPTPEKTLTTGVGVMSQTLLDLFKEG
ncbi:MAG TPA: amidohydrolase [Saprospiraceae bacterium]|nr:amidohydrolase [Saprospiraceae bacterium]